MLRQALIDSSRELLDELIAFCQEDGGMCFKDWPRPILEEYLAFHACNQSLAFVRSPGTKRIIGLAIGWQCRGDELERDWYPNNPAGDVFLFSQLVCAEPGALRSLVRNFESRHPHWRRLKLMARRIKKGRVVTYEADFIERLKRK